MLLKKEQNRKKQEGIDTERMRQWERTRNKKSVCVCVCERKRE